jgi:hypothetical protein
MNPFRRGRANCHAGGIGASLSSCGNRCRRG